jgi:hypothetical protein
MLTAREKILVEGQHDWVQLDRVHEYVAFENLSASLPEVQRRTLELVQSMAEEGLLELGDVKDYGVRFVPWDIPIDEAIHRLAAEYVDRFDDHAGWPWTLFMAVTDKGKRLARSYEPEYTAWLAELRAQGREYEALPSRFVPDANPP